MCRFSIRIWKEIFAWRGIHDLISELWPTNLTSTLGGPNLLSKEGLLERRWHLLSCSSRGSLSYVESKTRPMPRALLGLNILEVWFAENKLYLKKFHGLSWANIFKTYFLSMKMAKLFALFQKRTQHRVLFVLDAYQKWKLWIYVALFFETRYKWRHS
jgi:hypothetical protein